MQSINYSARKDYYNGREFMFCNNCGKEIAEASVICPFCHNRASHVFAESSSIGILAVLSFFIPIVGIILYFDWGSSNPQKANRAGSWALAGILLYIMITAAVLNKNVWNPWLNSKRGIAEELYNNDRPRLDNDSNADASTLAEANRRFRLFYIAAMKDDIDGFANSIISAYKIDIAKSENPNSDGTFGNGYSDAEFMSKEWVAQRLGFRKYDLSHNNNNAEYRLISVINDEIIIKALSTEYQGHSRVMVKGVINVRTGKVVVMILPDTQF